MAHAAQQVAAHSKSFLAFLCLIAGNLGVRGALTKAGWRGLGRRTPSLCLSPFPSLGLVKSGTEIKGISLTLGPVIRKLFTDLEDRDSVSREGVMAEGPGECQASQGSPLTPPQSACLLAAGTSGFSPMSPCCSLRDRTVPSPSPQCVPLSQAVLGCSSSTAPSFCFPLLSYPLYQCTSYLTFLFPSFAFYLT